ncbi:hypothetical protein B0A55_00002 [Friedmanniomyces simplex]|uniref:BAH domain-containing protein n=1 Tax=Friedmanniomyces simplex TaxID=329884 RepID=A0A4U0Y068_9PEZI|nr:hypothetical protein B0A55_00002 [Friedmanniomyces simplex]
MRTKMTGPSQKKARKVQQAQQNGTPPRSPPAAPQVRSPPQAQELSHEDRASLKEFLENSDKPFSVTTIPPSRKRKRPGTDPAVRTEGDLFETRLTVDYEIKPTTNWDSMKRYKKFTVGTESIALGEYIMVKHDLSQDPRIDPSAQWKAKVLEVRALDPEHVYIRVAWLNRPEDLDGGRQPHHGKNELIPTNQLDIIDAMTINGRLDLYAWDEKDDDSPMPGIGEYYWRQTYDFANTKTFSKLLEICQDRKPQNPDQMILQCEAPKCRKWMHVDCIINDAVQRASPGAAAAARRKGKAVTTTTTRTKKKQKKSAGSVALLEPTPPAIAIAQKDAYTAEFFVKGSPNGSDETPSRETKIVVTDGEGGRRKENVRCLFCRESIEPSVAG